MFWRLFVFVLTPLILLPLPIINTSLVKYIILYYILYVVRPIALNPNAMLQSVTGKVLTYVMNIIVFICK